MIDSYTYKLYIYLLPNYTCICLFRYFFLFQRFVAFVNFFQCFFRFCMQNLKLLCKLYFVILPNNNDEDFYSMLSSASGGAQHVYKNILQVYKATWKK